VRVLSHRILFRFALHLLQLVIDQQRRLMTVLVR
jgi:hypothetical protein